MGPAGRRGPCAVHIVVRRGRKNATGHFHLNTDANGIAESNTYADTYAHTHADTYAHTYTYVHAYTHDHAYTYVHAYTHDHAYGSRGTNGAGSTGGPVRGNRRA